MMGFHLFSLPSPRRLLDNIKNSLRSLPLESFFKTRKIVRHKTIEINIHHSTVAAADFPASMTGLESRLLHVRFV